MNFQEHLALCIRAGHNLLYIDTPEEMRVKEAVLQAAKQHNFGVINYDTVDGMQCLTEEVQAEGYIDSPYYAIRSCVDEKLPRVIYMFHDLGTYLNDQVDVRCRRVLRGLIENRLLEQGKERAIIILIQPDWEPHPELKHLITRVEFPLPTAEEIQHEVERMEKAIQETKDESAVVTCPADLKVKITKSLEGLTHNEIETAISLGIVQHKGFRPSMLQTIQEVKAQTLKNDTVLEYVHPDKLPGTDEVGGFDNYLQFLDDCSACYTEAAEAVRLGKPKGVALLGIPGTGKSLVGLVTAKALGLPLIKYNFAGVFGSLVGQSEQTQEKALRRISAMGPCVLFIDEADKAFAGAVGGGGDSGVNSRIFGKLLSWLANDNKQAFVVMTLNRIVDHNQNVLVPIETLRAGRLDEIFYTTFPVPEERRTIFDIHFSKQGVTDFQVPSDALNLTNEYVGSEIEQVVIKSVRKAFRQRQTLEPTKEELIQVIKEFRPIAQLDKASVAAIEKFVRDKATPVSSITPKPSTKRKLLLNANHN